jgi:HK97 family phage portal protein
MFAWLRGIWSRTSPPDRAGGTNRHFFSRTASRVWVDGDTSLRNATAWACVQYLTKAVAQLPWRVIQDLPNGGCQPMPSNPADYLLHRRPNPEMGPFAFRQTLLGWALRYGNGYAEIEWDQRGAPYALWPIHPNRVEPRRDDAGVLFYRVHSPNGGISDLDASDMYHVRGFGDGVVGLNVIEYAAESIGWAQATTLFGAAFFGEGMNPSGIVEVAGGLKPEGLAVLRDQMKALYQGPRAQRTVFLDAGMKFTKVATNPNDSQFVETMQHQVNEICRWFGVPPHKVMHLLNATFSNIEHQSIEVVVDSVTPWVRVFEDEANFKLFPRPNRQNLYTKIDLKGLLRGDHAARAALYKTMFETGSISPNRILALEDMNPIGPAGDQHFVPLNMVPLDLARATAERNAEPAPDPVGLTAPADPPTANGRRLPN